MNVICRSGSARFPQWRRGDLHIRLFGDTYNERQGEAGRTMIGALERKRLSAPPAAWDFLSIATAVIAVDQMASRGGSPDGWTRVLDIDIPVSDPDFWNSQAPRLQDALRFLSTDLWTITFSGGGYVPPERADLRSLAGDCVSLLSGGMDSLIGGIDHQVAGRHPILVSQVANGDKNAQSTFARATSPETEHWQLNPNPRCGWEMERSQRARSIGFLALGVLAATATERYAQGGDITFYVCENGLISMNPPLTPGRIGGLSTRTTHPTFLDAIRDIVDAALGRIEIVNPYQHRTKGEMLRECGDQELLERLAFDSTSCGRYARFGFTHCGRCVPCIIRRSAVHAWGQTDRTRYVYDDLGRDDGDHARFDDVRSASMALAAIGVDGIDRWLGASLVGLADRDQYRHTVERGMAELDAFLRSLGVQ